MEWNGNGMDGMEWNGRNGMEWNGMDNDRCAAGFDALPLMPATLMNAAPIGAELLWPEAAPGAGQPARDQLHPAAGHPG